MPKKAIVIPEPETETETKPKTKRTNKRSGLNVEEQNEPVVSDKILNPITGKYVSRNGKIGLKIISELSK